MLLFTGYVPQCVAVKVVNSNKDTEQLQAMKK